MSGTFTGFGSGMYEFFEGLAANNDRSWFAEHKALYETEVREPLEALFADLEPRFGEARIFRLQRDLRFSNDKTPYKTAQAGIIHLGRGSTRYLQVGAEGVTIGAGSPHMDSGQVLRFREAVAGRPGEALTATIDALRSKGHTVGTLGPEGITMNGDLKRVPSDFSPDHPRAGLLRCKSMIAAVVIDRPAWLFEAKAVNEVAKRWTAMQPIVDWLDAHVGPGDPAPAGRRR